MTAVHDALVALTERRSHADARAMLDELTEREKLTMEAVTYLRGRSLLGTFVLVDEAQNLEPTTLKTILTRVGEGTKVVFTGDTSQIDAPYLSEHNNAVSVLIDAFERRALLRAHPPRALRALRGGVARRAPPVDASDLRSFGRGRSRTRRQPAHPPPRPRVPAGVRRHRHRAPRALSLQRLPPLQRAAR